MIYLNMFKYWPRAHTQPHTLIRIHIMKCAYNWVVLAYNNRGQKPKNQEKDDKSARHTELAGNRVKKRNIYEKSNCM